MTTVEESVVCGHQDMTAMLNAIAMGTDLQRIMYLYLTYLVRVLLPSEAICKCLLIRFWYQLLKASYCDSIYCEINLTTCCLT